MDDKLHSHLVPILAYRNEVPVDVSYLSKGATCTVWRVHSDVQNYALRVVEENERVLDGIADEFIRNSVLRRGGVVAAPFLNSEAAGHRLDGKRWTLEQLIEGTHPPRGALPKRTCRKLGQTLAALHQVPAREFGHPSEISEQVVIGTHKNPVTGVSQRFENPLPETWTDGVENPALTAMPEYKQAIMAHLREVSARVKEGEHVVCHTDLHEGQLMCHDEKLVALLDFGGASILNRHWDLGSVRYFHGERNFAEVYDSYETTLTEIRVVLTCRNHSLSPLPYTTHRGQGFRENRIDWNGQSDISIR